MEAQAFTLDTSGVVYVGKDRSIPGGHVEWSDLTPFQQGYVEALFAEFNAGFYPVDGGQGLHGFRHLSPAALERIMGDCERAVQLKNGWTPLYRKTRAGGAAFWTDRNRYPPGWRTGSGDVWFPLTASLSPEGSVNLSEGK